MDSITITGKRDSSNGPLTISRNPGGYRLTPRQRAFWLETIVPNLRSGKRRQVIGRLRDRNDSGNLGYCCLGSATLDVKQAGVLVYTCSVSLAEGSILSLDVANWLGVGESGLSFQGVEPTGYKETKTLTDLNDAFGFTFKQIADVIEFLLTDGGGGDDAGGTQEG